MRKKGKTSIKRCDRKHGLFILHAIRTNMNRRFFLIIVVLVTISSLLRIAYIVFHPVQPRDYYKYESCIYDWENKGEMPEEIKGGLSIWLLKAPYHFFKYDLLKGGVVINVILGSLITVFSILILYNIFNSSIITIVVGLILATHPTLIELSCFFLRENSYLFFALLSMYGLVRFIKRKSIIMLLLSGIMCTLSFLCRFEGAELIPISLLLISCILIHDKTKLKKVLLYDSLYVFSLLATFFLTNMLLGLRVLSLRFLHNILVI